MKKKKKYILLIDYTKNFLKSTRENASGKSIDS